VTPETPIPASWLQCRLGDVVAYGDATKAEPSEIPSSAWVLELEDVEKDTSKVLKRLRFGERRSRSTKNKFHRGDVLYGKLRPYLNKVVRADEDGYCTTEMIPLGNSPALDNGFLFYWLKHPVFQEYVEAVSHGLNMPRLGTEAGNDAPFVLAPLNEQKRVADKLDGLLARVDACRSALDRVLDLLACFRQAVLAAATSGELTEKWREEQGVDVSWAETTIGSVAIDLRYGTSQKCSYEPRGVPVLRIPNIVNGAVNQDDLKYGPLEEGELTKLALLPGDILLIRSNGSVDLVGRPAVVTESEAGFAFAGYLIRLRVNSSQVTPKFVALSLLSPQTRNAISLMARSTSGVNNINSEEIRSLDLALPALPEQTEIVRRVEALFTLADRAEAQLAAGRAEVEALTPSILAKAFRGELVPQDRNDEPASALLERIQVERANMPIPAKHQTKVSRRSRIEMKTRAEIDPAHLSMLLKERGPLRAYPET